MYSDNKKNHRADLEKKKGYFFQAGLIAALSVVLLAFEWRSYESTEELLSYQGGENIIEEIIPVTRQEQPKPIAVAVPRPKSPVIEIVNNDADISDQTVNDNNPDPDNTDPLLNQMPENSSFDADIFTVVEEPPMFPGGDDERMRFLQRNIIYPQMARQNKIQGTVYITFVIETDGSVTNIRILQGIGAGCDEEAMRVVQMMPRWIPGKQRGVPVRVMLNMPLRFTLQTKT